ncbi:hypothetical protein AVEN_71221-1 [Araneus ventricosus]|uniref:Uncharacterized protein n=1 Tax=Araneus ventricosus TaxID=182803 RepID=A0A4Y2IPV7_ARAVE|nr:hypothetical protein AVEN_71221-1 [Araneus ventricosus]
MDINNGFTGTAVLFLAAWTSSNRGEAIFAPSRCQQHDPSSGSQPRQVESEWVEQAEAAQILPNQNEAALVADQRAGFKFNWEERRFKRFSVSNLSQRTGREACQLHLVNILLDPFSAGQKKRHPL